MCHGNVIRYFICRALQVDPSAWLRCSFSKGSGGVGVTFKKLMQEHSQKESDSTDIWHGMVAFLMFIKEL